MSRGTIPSGFQDLVNELLDRGAAVMQLPGDLPLVETAAALVRSIAEAGRVASPPVLAHCESVDPEF